MIKQRLQCTEVYVRDMAYRILKSGMITAPNQSQKKLLWDFNIQTDKVIEARQPDLVLVDKEKKERQIIDIAIPGDTGVVKRGEDREIQRARI